MKNSKESDSIIQVSIVCAIYNETACLQELAVRLEQTLEMCAYEIIFVDDGSTDGTWGMIKELRKENQNIKGIQLSRNFGHHIALKAGLDLAIGKWIVLMDGDLQDPPESIHDLLREANKGFDIVVARRIQKKHSIVKRALSKLFSLTMSWMSGVNFDSSEGIFRVFNNKVGEALKSMQEEAYFLVGLINWLGFSVSTIDINHQSRYSGSSKYSLNKQARLAILALISFSDKPLKIVMLGGFLFSFIGFIYAGYIIQQAVSHQIAVSGYASLISVILIISGITIFCVGLVGLYVGKIFSQVKFRPLYLLRETTGIQTAPTLP